MDRSLRALSERIRFLEGFDVEIVVRKGHTIPSELGRYDFTRAASRKWTIEYWEKKRNQWEFLEFRIRDQNGEFLSRDTPLDVARRIYHRNFGSAGVKMKAKVECKSDEVAMQLRRELLEVGIDASYRLEKFLFFKTHILEWESPDLRMSAFEQFTFEKVISDRVEKLDSDLEFQYVSGEESRYLDECPDEYHFISSVGDLK